MTRPAARHKPISVLAGILIGQPIDRTGKQCLVKEDAANSPAGCRHHLLGRIVNDESAGFCIDQLDIGRD
jgi:hypothetical protein